MDVRGQSNNRTPSQRPYPRGQVRQSVRRGRAGLRVLFETGKARIFLASIFMPLEYTGPESRFGRLLRAVRVPF
jgi:hypothetical protein